MKKNRRMLKIFCDIWFWFSVVVSILFYVLYLLFGLGTLFSGLGMGVIAILFISVVFVLSIVVLCIIRYFILCIIDISETNEMIANSIRRVNNTETNKEEIKKEDDAKQDADDRQIDKKVINAFKQHEENAKKDIESDE